MVKWGRKRPRRLIYAVGLYTLGYGIYDMVYPAITQNARDKLDLKQRYGAHSWVVVTGATNELGREFASKFNQQGFNVLMVDINGEELARAKDEIAQASYSPDA
jgi:short chain dehydrogenase